MSPEYVAKIILYLIDHAERIGYRIVPLPLRIISLKSGSIWL